MSMRSLMVSKSPGIPRRTLPAEDRSRYGRRYGLGSVQRFRAEQTVEALDVHRLCDVLIESGVERLPAVARLAVPGQRDQRGGETARSKPARDIVAIHLGQADVEQHELR